MDSEWLVRIDEVPSALFTGFVMGKLSVDPSSVWLEEIGRLDTRFIEPLWES